MSKTRRNQVKTFIRIRYGPKATNHKVVKSSIFKSQPDDKVRFRVSRACVEKTLGKG